MTKELKFLLYTTPQGDISIDVVVKDETLWLTQKAMGELFDVQIPAISKHIKNIYQEGELSENATISKMETVVNRGFRGEIMEELQYYNLDMIISVGYRVNSAKATQFRIWATKTLNEFLAFRKYNILKDKGRISKSMADKKAKMEYEEFNKTQKIISDFDKEIKRLKNNENENNE